MITAILIVLILCTGILGAYTLNFQRAIIALAKKLASKDPEQPKGVQDAIEAIHPKIQTICITIFIILFVAALVICFVFYQWYLNILFAGLTLVWAAILVTVLPLIRVLPRPESEFYKQKIKQDLLRRQSRYKKAGKVDKELAVEELLRRFDGLD